MPPPPMLKAPTSPFSPGDRLRARVTVHTRNALFAATVHRALKARPFRIHVAERFDDAEHAGPRTPGVLVLDADWMAVMSRRSIAAVNLKTPEHRKLLVGDMPGPQMCEFLALGFHGFLTPAKLEKKLAEAVDCLLRGRCYVPPNLLEQYVAYTHSKRQGAARPDRLTPRQSQIVQMLQDGAGNKQISSALQISENTVRFHLAQLFEKTGLHDRNALGRFFSASQPKPG